MKRPPRVAKALLGRCIPPGVFRDSVLGDLEEGFNERLKAGSARSAATWYRYQAVRVGLRYLVERTLNRRIYTRSPDRKTPRRDLGEGVLLDLRFAIRTLCRRPLFTTVAVLTLGLGIGAATAMFSVVDGVLVKPLPYSEPDRLVAVWQTMPRLEGVPGDDGARWDRYRLTYAQYRDLSEQSGRYRSLAAYRAGNPDVARLTGVGDPVELPAGAASASLLNVLGVSPALGRWFSPAEEASRAGDDGAAVAVISYELWQGRFAGSRETLGGVVTIDDTTFTVVGILPPGFAVQWLSASIAGEPVPDTREIWFPIGAPGWRASRWAYSWETVGRLGSRVTVEQAQAESQAILSAHANTDADGEIRVIARSAEESRGLGFPLLLLFGATGLLLVIACGNIAVLATAEVLSRRHEIATRSAMGAGAARIVRLLLTENLVLAFLGSVVGMGLASAGTDVLVALAPPIPRLSEVVLDLRTLGFTALLGACSACLFGTVPALLAIRAAGTLAVRRPTTGSLGRRSFSGVVIGMEMALTAVLLVGAGLLVRSLSQLLAVDPGFDAHNLATVEVFLPETRYPTDNQRAKLFKDVLGRLEAIPGIGTVSGVSRLPFPGHTSAWRIEIQGRDQPYGPLGYQVEPGYLEMLGVPLLAGRPLAVSDEPDAPLVVVINETMARRYWPDEPPVGAQFLWSGSEGPVTVVGIVGDMKRQRLGAQSEPAFFIPFSQHPDETVCVVARTELEPDHIIPLMREAVWSVDRQLALRNATTMAALVTESAGRERYGTTLVGVFGILAAVLAAAGVFGVTARSVAARTHEMGIRMALGARGSGLVATSVRNILYTGIAGTAIGLTVALCFSRLISRFLFEIEPSDPTTYGVVAALMLVVCLLASLVPARCVSKLDPLEVLRVE